MNTPLTKHQSTFLIFTPLVFFIVLFVFFLYTFLHESGHALAGLLCGQTLTEFNVKFWDFSAHVNLAGGNLTPSQLALRSAAGVSLPFLIWVVFMSLVPRKASFTLEALKLISSMAVINTLLAWIILPILFILGKAPSDDVTHFLRYSHISPWLLTSIALISYVGGWLLFLSRIDGLRNEFLVFRLIDRQQLLAGTPRSIPVLTGIMAFCVILIVTLNTFAGKNTLHQFSTPPGFAPVAEIDLSARAYSFESLTQFSLEKPALVGIFIKVQDINTTYFDLIVVGPAGYRSIVLHGEGYRADQDGGLWEASLPAGTYQVVLTSHQSPGTASVYLRTP